MQHFICLLLTTPTMPTFKQEALLDSQLTGTGTGTGRETETETGDWELGTIDNVCSPLLCILQQF